MDLPVAYSEIDTEGVFRVVNGAACRLFGAAQEDLVGHSIFEFVPSDQVADDRAAFLSMIEADVEPAVIRRSLYTSTGEFRVHELHRGMLRDEEGNAVGIRSVTIDVSDAEIAHAEARQAKLWLESVVLAIPQAVMVTDALGFVRFANTSAERVTGRMASELVGKQVEKGMPILRAVSPSGKKLSFRAALEEIWNGDVELLNHDGETVSTWLSACPIYDKATGFTNGVVIVFRASTAQTRASANPLEAIEQEARGALRNGTLW
jgi:PAS domain S-box-containing protein